MCEVLETAFRTCVRETTASFDGQAHSHNTSIGHFFEGKGKKIEIVEVPWLS